MKMLETVEICLQFHTLPTAAGHEAGWSASRMIAVILPPVFTVREKAVRVLELEAMLYPARNRNLVLQSVALLLSIQSIC
jgi:hypothetical protein